jgi:hypothetical protein
MRRRATLAAAHYLRTDATEVLMKDHQKVQGMLRTVISSAGASPPSPLSHVVTNTLTVAPQQTAK